MLFPAAGSPSSKPSGCSSDVSTVGWPSTKTRGHVKDVVQTGSLHKAPEAVWHGEPYSMHALNKGG